MWQVQMRRRTVLYGFTKPRFTRIPRPENIRNDALNGETRRDREEPVLSAVEGARPTGVGGAHTREMEDENVYVIADWARSVRVRRLL